MFIRAILPFLTLSFAVGTVWYPDGPCGRSKYPDAGEHDLPGYNPLIVGGIEARPHEFPWMASLWSSPSPTGTHFCGAEVIHPEWVMTAAHCVQGRNASWIRVIVGEHTRSDTSNPNRAELVAEHYFVHEEYNENARYDADIALIKLTEPMTFSENVQPICPPEDDKLYDHAFSQISGWGLLESDGPCCPDTLIYTTVNVTTNEYCQKLYSDYDITDNMICSSDNGDHTDRDSCQGDSGGPMSIKEEDGTFRVIGIVSWGLGCASGYPGVYARVTPFNNWVLDKIAKN